MEGISIKCRACGAPLEVDALTKNVDCMYCGTKNIIPKHDGMKITFGSIIGGIRNVIKSKFGDKNSDKN